MHDLGGEQKFTAIPRYEPYLLFHNFFQILKIFVIRSSYSIKGIILQLFYHLAVYALANDITSSILTALGLAINESKKRH